MYQGKCLLRTENEQDHFGIFFQGVKLRKNITTFNLEQISFECCEIKTYLYKQ